MIVQNPETCAHGYFCDEHCPACEDLGGAWVAVVAFAASGVVLAGVAYALICLTLSWLGRVL